ncbi:cation-transporting P-type ATPase [Maribacter sp. ACAM166]|uniref:cation-transporting P-type ATPase n=1 Tax=Maribacter sp. ACAM166 TaxID=2508996 RepID=UPI0010FE8830|nr:hypothetical protein ES765_16255 [Maribacter sp. ACAM166]
MTGAGTNTIVENKHVLNLLFLFNQFKNPFMAQLLIADILAFFLGKHVDTIIIFNIIIFSGFLSFCQETIGHKNSKKRNMRRL